MAEGQSERFATPAQIGAAAPRFTDEHNVYTPERWQPGGEVIEPVPAISAEGGLDPDWSYRTRKREAPS